MTKEEAIDVLKHNYPSSCYTDLCEAVDIAIQALSIQPDLNEWCTDCKEYDQEKHCCPRFNRVIRETLDEIEKQKTGKWISVHDDIFADRYYCSCCKAEPICNDTEYILSNFCPNCGADMRGEEK